MNKIPEADIKLTSFSRGAGCGCKIAPNVLQQILGGASSGFIDNKIIVGNESFDDAAVYDFDDEYALISTTDFFTPIVDDPYDFGAISAVNAISDVYAMGGEPLMAISILGWPLDNLAPEIASRVISGAKDICRKAEISLAGGHSIDSAEPIFGLAVTGKVKKSNIKRNSGATPGCSLFLTKPLGIGIMTTAQKKGLLADADLRASLSQMLSLNKIGADLGPVDSVKAVTDVTGFGLLGHLLEMCLAGNVSAEIEYSRIPRLENLEPYIQKKCIPGGTFRNFSSYGEKILGLNEENKAVLCDPQTSGGLLIAVVPEGEKMLKEMLKKRGLVSNPFGKIIKKAEKPVIIY